MTYARCRSNATRHCLQRVPVAANFFVVPQRQSFQTSLRYMNDAASSLTDTQQGHARRGRTYLWLGKRHGVTMVRMLYVLPHEIRQIF